MRLFRNYTFTWPQAVLFKLYIFSAGLLVGAYGNEVVREWSALLVVLFVTLLVYFSYLLLRGRL